MTESTCERCGEQFARVTANGSAPSCADVARSTPAVRAKA